jgi:hypothetical protein
MIDGKLIDSGIIIGTTMRDLRKQLEKQAGNRQKIMMSDREFAELQTEHSRLWLAISTCRVWEEL